MHRKSAPPALYSSGSTTSNTDPPYARSHPGNNFTKSTSEFQAPGSLSRSSSVTSDRSTGRRSSGGGGGSQLAQSMRYADPWLYRHPAGTGATSPLATLTGCGGAASFYYAAPYHCACAGPPYYSTTGCAKCAGSNNGSGVRKYSTVRYYGSNVVAAAASAFATSPAPNGYSNGGTMRALSTYTKQRRPSILDMDGGGGGAEVGDPYDLMRKNRLITPEQSGPKKDSDKASGKDQRNGAKDEGGTIGKNWLRSRSKSNKQLVTTKLAVSATKARARSTSPKGKRQQDGTGRTANNSNNYTNQYKNIYATFGRRSILECHVNPYDLMSYDGANKNSPVAKISPSKTTRTNSTSRTTKEDDNGGDVTTLNGQRIRVRPPSIEPDYDDVTTPFKSILKKSTPSSTPASPSIVANAHNSDIDAAYSHMYSTQQQEHAKLPANAMTTQFYVPSPTSNNMALSPSSTTTRKKVQFLMAPEKGSVTSSPIPERAPRLDEQLQLQSCELRKKLAHIVASTNTATATKSSKVARAEMQNGAGYGNGDGRGDDVQCSADDGRLPETVPTVASTTATSRKTPPANPANNGLNGKPSCKLQRSISERLNQCGDATKSQKVTFHDTMALRVGAKPPIADVRALFSNVSDLARLDGLASKRNAARPNEPPPLPPDIITTTYEHMNCQTNVQPVYSDDYEDMDILKNSLNTMKDDGHSNYEDVIEIRNSRKVIEEKDNDADNALSLAPPSAPPRKRSNNKTPFTPIVVTPTVVQINTPITAKRDESRDKRHHNYKITIKNDYSDPALTPATSPDPESPQSVNVVDCCSNQSIQSTTSIIINGDDCYSTINVNNEYPFYHSSVVVHDSSSNGVTTSKVQTASCKSSTVYITPESSIMTDRYEDVIILTKANGTDTTSPKEEIEPVSELSSELLKVLLCDPVEAVRRNLVPHVCGKADVTRRTNNSTAKLDVTAAATTNSDPIAPSAKSIANGVTDPDEDFLMKLSVTPEEREKEYGGGDDSEHSGSTAQYELMLMAQEDGTVSECYSNRSSITEEELTARTKFYELLADAALVEEVMAGDERDDDDDEEDRYDNHHYESIRLSGADNAGIDPIYEDIEIPPPLPTVPPPSQLLDDLQLDKEYTTRSIFEGASKYDILSYLVDAKERGIDDATTPTAAITSTNSAPLHNHHHPYSLSPHLSDDLLDDVLYTHASQLSTISDSSEDCAPTTILAPNSPVLLALAPPHGKGAEVERNDSGVGSETSKCSLSKYRSSGGITSLGPGILVESPSSSSLLLVAPLCEDCEETHIEPEQDMEAVVLLCRKCQKRRNERKETIMEIVETEEKYSRDLQIILEEFYQPMLVAGLLTAEQLSAIFLNVEELLENSQALAERLRDAVEIAFEQGDEDLQTVHIGKLFLEAAPMLHGFETYCVRQGGASLLLAGLEKDKELLRIFLRVSQMENTLLRRMNLNSFLMVPVQRVTKYPLLLARLYKVTPVHHDTREQLQEAQHKIELHLNHMNSETKDVPSKLWRRISSLPPGRRCSSEMDLVNIKLRKIAVDVLDWNHDEAGFALEGRLLYTQPQDNNWRKGRTIKLSPVNALLVTYGKNSRSEQNNNNNSITGATNQPGPNSGHLIFARQPGIREAALLLVRDKNGRYSLLRDPLYLDRCVIAADPAWQSYFEVQELLGKDTFIFKAEDDEQTKIWYRQLQYYAQGMGTWRKRRNALANIMINGMGLRS